MLIKLLCQSMVSWGGMPSSVLTLSLPCSAAHHFGCSVFSVSSLITLLLGSQSTDFWVDMSLTQVLSFEIKLEDTSSGISLAINQLVLPLCYPASWIVARVNRQMQTLVSVLEIQCPSEIYSSHSKRM